MRTVDHRYRDPLDEVWLGAAEQLGLRIERSAEVFASYDGRGTLRLSTPEHLDADDSLAQLVLHELCHWAVMGDRGFREEDWGLDNRSDRDLVKEHACHRVQAALCDAYGLRDVLAVTTDHRPYWDALPADPLAEGADPAIALAREALARAKRGRQGEVLADALERTAAIVHVVRPVAAGDSLFRASGGKTSGGKGPSERDPFERIVCLTEEPTEILYRLGEQRRIVGISAYTVRPAHAREDKPVVSAFIDGSVRKIKGLEPDLVIGFSDIQSKLAADLIAAGLQVLIFNQRSLEEILDVIVAIGRLVGKEAAGQCLAGEFAHNLEATRARAHARARKRKRRPRVYFEEWDDPMICGIRWVSELIEAAGGEDIFAERSHGPIAKDRFVRAEEVCERAPEIVVASWCGKPFDAEAFAARPGFEKVPAVRQGRVHELDPAIILQPGPACLSDGLAALESLIAAVDE